MSNANGNLLTPQEAAHRWCPFSNQISPGVGGGVNRDLKGELLKGSTCVSNKCMMWRWDHSTPGDYGSCGLAGSVGSVKLAEVKR